MRTLLCAALVAVACSVSAQSVEAREKKCEFVDDDGACNKMDSVQPIQLIKKGISYAELRRKAIALGYTPVPAGSDPSRCLPEMKGNCDTYPETISCKSAGGSDCHFLLGMNGVWFVVDTLGEGTRQKFHKVHWLNMRDQKDLQMSLN